MASGKLQKPYVIYQHFDAGDTLQLSGNMLACALIFITIRRYGYWDTVEVPSLLVTTGSVTTGGCKLNYGNNVITATISATGVITLSGTGSNEVMVDVYGL